VCVLGEKWVCPTFGGYVQGVAEVKDKFVFVYFCIMLPHHILSRVLHCKYEKIKLTTSPNHERNVQTGKVPKRAS